MFMWEQVSKLISLLSVRIRYDRGQGSSGDRKDGGPEAGEYEPVDNCVNSVLGQEVELTEEFKANYEKWLQREVYSTQIDWDQLLAANHL